MDLGARITGFVDSGPNKNKPANRRLRKFHEKGASLSSRFRSLISFVEKSPEEEIRKFFNDNFYVIYGVFLDMFSSYENQCKRGKHDASTLKELLTILKSVLDYLTDYVKKGWQIRSIATVLEKVLYTENKYPYRKQAFELLMQFLEAVRLREEAQTDLLGAAINLQPLTAKYNMMINLMALPLSAPDKQCILLPSNGTVSIQESVELFEILLSFLDQPDPDVFLFWWDLLKQQYLCVFYPSIWPNKTGPGKIGFPKCPEEIQSVLLTRLLSIVKKKSLMEVMWREDDDKQLMLEIFQQSIMLHVNFDETIKKSITLFKICYLESPSSALSGEHLASYRASFIRNLLGILTCKQYNDNESMKKLEALSLEIVHLFKNMFAEPYSIDDATLEVLYFTLLETASEVLSPNTTRPSLSKALHGDLCDTILFIWIITRTKNPVHWERLCSTMAGLLQNTETINQVSQKIMQLTLVLQEKIYFKTEKKKTKGKQRGMMAKTSTKDMEPKSPDSVNPPILSCKDDLIHRIDWTVEDILFVWRNMLQIFGTINTLKPAFHLHCLEKLWQVISSIMYAESTVPYQETLDPNRPPFLCVIDIFGHLLFSACDLPDAFVSGKAQAYKILCKMFCRDHIRPLPVYLLSHFYEIIQEGLVSRDNKNTVQDSIICNSSNIFNLALPGANILIPYYLVEIRRILTGEGRGTDVKERAVIILSSLICFSSHFSGALIPVGGSEKTKVKDGNSSIHDFMRIASNSSGGRSSAVAVSPFPFSSLLTDVLSIMTDALKLEHLDPIIKVRLIWGVCVALFEIVYNRSAANLVISNLVLILLKHLTSQARGVSRAAVHAVTCLAVVAEEFSEMDPTLLATIVESMSANIVKEVSEFRSNRSYPIDEALVSDQLYCLLEWLLVFGETATNDPKLVGKVFESLETALTGVILNVTKTGNRKSRKAERPSTMIDVPVEDLYAQSINVVDPANIALPQIREAAENVVLHLLHFQHNVPGKDGIETLSSFISHTDDIPEGLEGKALHFVHNDSLMFSLAELPKPSGEGTFARVIVRDTLGKYAWDTEIAFDYDKMDPCPALPFNFTDKMPPSEPAMTSPVKKIPEPNVDPSVVPFHSNVYDQEVDQLDLLLRHLSHKYEDLLPENKLPLYSPAMCVEAQKARIDYTEQALVQQIEEDRQGMAKKQEAAPPSQVWQMSTPEVQRGQGAYHHCRMLLSNLGFLSYENFGTVSLLGGESEKVMRSLNQLDLTNGREMIKVGLIYLREGQEDQIEVLRNDKSCRSPLFNEFVRSIGWPIDVQTHRAYLGGLDPKLTTGVTAPYYATSTFELIFHDLTSMPTTEDPQQIHKKRHVGNDNVHIVWTEHLRDYNPRTIVSEFNDAHIVVYPLPNGLFKIHVYQKETVELFGPLLHGMCVSKKILPALTRVTCLMANKYVRYTHEGYVTPFANRKRVLNQIVERHKIEAPYHELIGNVVP